MGNTGQGKCPDGYKEILDEVTCEIASNFLSLSFDEASNVVSSTSVCYWCGGCSTKITTISNKHGTLAKFICQKGISRKDLEGGYSQFIVCHSTNLQFLFHRERICNNRFNSNSFYGDK